MKHYKPSLLFRDILLSLLAVFIMTTILAVPLINPVAKNSEVLPPGTMSVEIRWPDRVDVDIDLWVREPGGEVVGYKRKHGKVFDLLRDDLGDFLDVLDLNYENAYSRGLPDGLYIVNIHYYRGTGSVQVKSLITINKKRFQANTQLVSVRDEITLGRFRIVDGKLARSDTIQQKVSPF